MAVVRRKSIMWYFFRAPVYLYRWHLQISGGVADNLRGRGRYSDPGRPGRLPSAGVGVPNPGHDLPPENLATPSPSSPRRMYRIG